MPGYHDGTYPSQAAIRHRVKKKNKRTFSVFSRGDMDLSFFIIVLTLLVIGVIMMFSASYAKALSESGGTDGTSYAVNQIIMAGVGIAALFFFSFFDYRNFAYPLVAILMYGGCLLLLILVPMIGVTKNGATRWLAIGSFFSFQPSEVMKFAIVVLFSYLICQNYNKMDTFKTGILPFGVLLSFVVILLMAQPHLSCTLLICMVAVVLLFVGGIRWKHMGILFLMGVVGIAAILLYKISSEGFTYFGTRIQSWLDPFSDEKGGTWQTMQSLIAIGSGGLFGLGLGGSRQKFMYLPETQNDFVFSIVCEELGFIGAVTVILLFLLLVIRGIYIASKAKDKFGMLITIGITVQIGLQAFLNIAVVSNVIPNTGISLPFFSYGGTALIMQLAEMGIVLNVSRQASMES